MLRYYRQKRPFERGRGGIIFVGHPYGLHGRFCCRLFAVLYFEKAKQILLEIGSLTTTQTVVWLAGVLEKAEKYDALMTTEEGELQRCIFLKEA